MMLRQSLFVSVFLGASLVGCGDPAGPGVSGNVVLGSGVDASGFQTLVLRAVPDTGTFDTASPKFDVPPPADETAWDPVVEDATGLTFPYAYSLGAVLGTTEQEKWRVFAWLTAATDGTFAVPASGEPFGTATFSVVSCGQYGGYCQTTAGVNVTVDQKAP